MTDKHQKLVRDDVDWLGKLAFDLETTNTDDDGFYNITEQFITQMVTRLYTVSGHFRQLINEENS